MSNVLQYYLTSVSPEISQTIYSQSIGGYCSPTKVYPQTDLGQNIGIYDKSFSISPTSENWENLRQLKYISIGSEIIKVVSITETGTVKVSERGVNGVFNMHLENDMVSFVSYDDIFNNVMNQNYEQYRCFAIKNISETDTAENVVLYFKSNSLNSNSELKVALEKPLSSYLSSSSSGWTPMSITDSTIAGVYDDNHFAECYLGVDSGDADGQGRIVSSFDGETGTFVFYDSFSSIYDYDVDVDYHVDPSPSQRVISGSVQPDTSPGNVTEFVSPRETSSLGFYSNSGSLFVADSILPNNLIYIWIKHSVDKGSSFYSNNSFAIDLKFQVA